MSEFDTMAVHKARIEREQAEAIADRILDDIMTAGSKERADFLKLYTADQRYLGGWSRSALRRRLIAGILGGERER